MRITGGELKGRTVRAPSGWATRPSSDRLRETLFDILGQDLGGAMFVDAYAGSGAVGLEAYSRGARPVIFVERSPAAVHLLRINLQALRVPGQIVSGSAEAALSRLARSTVVALHSGSRFIFMDPPYAAGEEYERVLSLLDRTPALAPAGTTIIAEAERRAALPESWNRLELARRHRVGNSDLLFYRVAAESAVPTSKSNSLSSDGIASGAGIPRKGL